jgi:hypothetical protein
MLEQRDGLERAVERAVAEALVAPVFEGRHAWVRVGAARYFADALATEARRAEVGGRQADGRVRCPSDADLTAAVSAAAQREAESRAQACFTQAMEHGGDWREVR